MMLRNFGSLVKSNQLHTINPEIISQKHSEISYVISPTYVMMGLSIKPAPKPSKTFAMNICETLLALYNINQAIINGKFVIIIDLLRPK